MRTVNPPEQIPVGRKKKPADAPSSDPAFERVEIQVPIGWKETVDAAAEELGLSRSAYVRMAVARQMQADKKAKGGGDG